VVNVSNRAHVHVGLRALKRSLCHDLYSLQEVDSHAKPAL
jgi:hypothetical protein